MWVWSATSIRSNQSQPLCATSTDRKVHTRATCPQQPPLRFPGKAKLVAAHAPPLNTPFLGSDRHHRHHSAGPKSNPFCCELASPLVSMGKKPSVCVRSSVLRKRPGKRIWSKSCQVVKDCFLLETPTSRIMNLGHKSRPYAHNVWVTEIISFAAFI